MIDKFRKKIIKIFPIIAIILLAALILSRVCTPDRMQTPEVRISAVDAAEHIGKIAEVCGYVASSSAAREVDGQPAFLNFENPYPNQIFTVVIWGRHRHLWPAPPEELYANRHICLTGRIRMHNNIPQIVVENPKNIMDM